MTIDDKGKYLFIKWGLRGPPTNRADRITREYHSIAKFLMDWQIEKYYQAMFARPRKYIKRFLEECGKVYLNPQFTTKDLGCVRGGLELIPLLLRFKRFFESRKEDVLKFSYGSFIEDFVSCTSPEGCCHVTYSVEEHVSITLDRSANRLISVAHWECEDDDTITNKMVTEEVTEWWIYTDWGELFFVGYEGEKAWLFDAQTEEVHTNFGLSYRIGKKAQSGGKRRCMCMLANEVGNSSIGL
jgi:hypothetical protein